MVLVTERNTKIQLLDAATARLGVWPMIVRHNCVQLEICCDVPTAVRKRWRIVMLHGAPIADSNGIYQRTKSAVPMDVRKN